LTRRVLVISAHPDDETLGSGGALLRHAAEGCSLHWIIATQPTEESYSAEWRTRRVAEIEAVTAAYPMTSVDELGFPAAGLDSSAMGDLIEKIRVPVHRIKPDIVYVVHAGDVHSDHRVVFDATIAVFKPFRVGWPHAIYSFECASSTNLAAPSIDNTFFAQQFCDVGDFIERKLEILRIYDSEVPAPPHPRSVDAVRALARYRGTSVSLEYAEAFMLIRQVR
jgi:N-acetylglucosamine malate deacetylase 1